ncbi:LOW QUALITY PROTEIN: copper transport protein ATOX1 [Rhinophrynus dorsalis]
MRQEAGLGLCRASLHSRAELSYTRTKLVLVTCLKDDDAILEYLYPYKYPVHQYGILRKIHKVPDRTERCHSVCILQKCRISEKEEFFVDMTCGGCSNAVSRVLTKLGGVKFDIDLEKKTVTTDSEHPVDLLLETLKKTGKEARHLGTK